jgi:hypothetical protein
MSRMPAADGDERSSEHAVLTGSTERNSRGDLDRVRISDASHGSRATARGIIAATRDDQGAADGSLD